MKKNKKDLLIMGVMVLIGIGCLWLVCLRAEQIDNNSGVNYEERY